jgi:hypothetical protein
MKLCTYTANGQTRTGIVVGDRSSTAASPAR